MTQPSDITDNQRELIKLFCYWKLWQEQEVPQRTLVNAVFHVTKARLVGLPPVIPSLPPIIPGQAGISLPLEYRECFLGPRLRVEDKRKLESLPP